MSFEIGVKADFDPIVHLFDGLARQHGFAVMLAINDTAKDVQRVQRAHQRQVFTVRRPRWVDLAVKIKPRATKSKLEAKVSIDPPGGQKRADIITKFEPGGIKRPRDGGHIAIPVQAKRTKAGVVSRRSRPKSFKFKRVGRSIRGERRTFVVPHVGIFQRVGRRRRSRVRLLYLFKHSVPIAPILDFIGNAERTVKRFFERNYSKAFERAVKTARR